MRWRHRRVTLQLRENRVRIAGGNAIKVHVPCGGPGTAPSRWGSKHRQVGRHMLGASTAQRAVHVGKWLWSVRQGSSCSDAVASPAPSHWCSCGQRRWWCRSDCRRRRRQRWLWCRRTGQRRRWRWCGHGRPKRRRDRRWHQVPHRVVTKGGVHQGHRAAVGRTAASVDNQRGL